MPSSVLCRAMLTCHPETYNPVVEEIEGRVSWTQDNVLAFTYALKGDLMRLRIPPPRPPRRADRLWQHMCFEAFIAVKGDSEYYEFNFAPSGEWAAYAFRRYRDGAPLVDEELAPRISVRSAENGLELDAIIRSDRLPALQPAAPLRLALSAVIEEDGGMLSYWELTHPPGSTDFHHPDAYA